MRDVTLWDPPITTAVHEMGDGEPLVFLHGAQGITASDPLLATLAERYRVIAPVHPGFVDPDDLDELRDVHDLALYHDELFDALDLPAAPVIGHSFGGMVAAELAAHFPHRVSKLVLAAPVGLWNDDYPVADFFTAFPFGINELLWADPASEGAVAAMTAMAQADAGADDPVTATLLRVLPGLITAGKYMWPIPDRGLSRRLRRITSPTLVVWGEKDKLAPPEYAADFTSGIAGATATFLPDAGHMAPWEAIEAFTAAVSEFL